MQNNKKTLMIIAGIAALVTFGLIYWNVNNGVTNSGNKKEAGLGNAYGAAQNSLGDCEVKTAQAANVVGAQAEKIDTILLDAVKGRYDKGSTAAPQVGGKALFSALVEAYPDLTQVSAAYTNMLTIVTGCRTDFRGAQSQLLDELRSFDAWRTGSWTVRHFGSDFPNNNLVARIGTNALYGRSAEDKMWQIILPSSTLKEYENGTLDPSTYNPFPTTTG